MGTNAQPDILALIAGLLEQEMGFNPADDRVLVYNTNWDLPRTEDMFLVVGMLADEPFGHGQDYQALPDGTFQSNQRLALSAMVTVDAFSVTTEARTRLPEIFFALQGDAAERLMEANALRIFRPEPFRDLSTVEASRRLNRYQTVVPVFHAAGQSRSVPWMTPPAKDNPSLVLQP